MKLWSALLVLMIVASACLPAWAEDKDFDWKELLREHVPAEDNDRKSDKRPGSQPDRSAGFIACPLDKARTDIVTALPEPWWSTPQIGKLEGTRISAIAGKKTLVCEYWAYGKTVSVMRLPPDDKPDCTAKPTGFECR